MRRKEENNMKRQKTVSILVLLIALLALVATVAGLIPGTGSETTFQSIHGQTVAIEGRGLYRYESVSVAAQAHAQDLVTLVLGIPLLLVSLLLTWRGKWRGRLLLTGTVGYFLYTYASYAFLAMYNPLFLCYVALMSLSFFAFVLCMMSYDIGSMRGRFREKLPVRLIGGALLFIAAMLFLLWMARILPPLLAGGVPTVLEHYSTLVIQSMDLGFVVPVSVVGAVLLIKRRPFGYLLAPVLIVKAGTLATAVALMGVMDGAGAAQVLVFGLMDLLSLFCLGLVLYHTKETEVAK